MNIIKADAYILSRPSREDALKLIEVAGRVCYKSEDRIKEGSDVAFLKMVLGKKHLSVVEHISASVMWVVDRGVSHELVRHRLASFSQESTRYCNYIQDKFSNEITFIDPEFWNPEDQNFIHWATSLQMAELAYMKMIQNGAKAQEARSVLPNSLKTELVMTANLREWMHFFKLRTAPSAHPQMVKVARKVLVDFQKWLPECFGEPPEETEEQTTMNLEQKEESHGTAKPEN